MVVVDGAPEVTGGAWEEVAQGVSLYQAATALGMGS